MQLQQNTPINNPVSNQKLPSSISQVLTSNNTRFSNLKAKFGNEEETSIRNRRQSEYLVLSVGAFPLLRQLICLLAKKNINNALSPAA